MLYVKGTERKSSRERRRKDWERGIRNSRTRYEQDFKKEVVKGKDYTRH